MSERDKLKEKDDVQLRDQRRDAGGVRSTSYCVLHTEYRKRATASQVPLKIPRKSRPGRWTVEAGETLMCSRTGLVPTCLLLRGTSTQATVEKRTARLSDTPVSVNDRRDRRAPVHSTYIARSTRYCVYKP